VARLKETAAPPPEMVDGRLRQRGSVEELTGSAKQGQLWPTKICFFAIFLIFSKLFVFDFKLFIFGSFWTLSANGVRTYNTAK
jgi:hypothetical protein